jgi:hypothetical protein
VPAAVEGDYLEVRVFFPSGPLAGDLATSKALSVRRGKN